MRSLPSDAVSQKTESTACSPCAVDKFSPLPSYKQSQSMAHKPSLAALLEKPLPGYPVLDIRADPVQPVPPSPTLLTLSQEFDYDDYSLDAATVTPCAGIPTIADYEEDDTHAGTAHTPDIV